MTSDFSALNHLWHSLGREMLLTGDLVQRPERERETERERERDTEVFGMVASWTGDRKTCLSFVAQTCDVARTNQYGSILFYCHVSRI